MIQHFSQINPKPHLIMEPISLCNCNSLRSSPLLFFNPVEKKTNPNFATNSTPFDSASKFKPSLASSSSSSSSSSSRVSCSYSSARNGDSDEERTTVSWAFGVLGLDPPCSSAQLKAAFRTKVKEFHPDVARDAQTSDLMIRRVIQAYEILTDCSKSEIIERECMDPFDQPECEAFDLFVNEALCFGKGCPYSCVDTAPHVFRFSSETGTAHAASQGHGEDYRVQRAVGLCPRSCIHYVTPSQRIILEELLDSIVGMPYDTSAEAEFLFALIMKAKFENYRYQSPKKKGKDKVSGKHVDWF